MGFGMNHQSVHVRHANRQRAVGIPTDCGANKIRFVYQVKYPNEIREISQVISYNVFCFIGEFDKPEVV
jgi:hypothetical protein